MTKTLKVVGLYAILPIAIIPVCLSITSCGGNDLPYISVLVMTNETFHGDETIPVAEPHIWTTMQLKLSKDGIHSKQPVWYSSSFTALGEGWYNRKWDVSYTKNYPYILDATGTEYIYWIDNGINVIVVSYYTFKAVK